MDGAAKRAVHLQDWKFTTLRREVGSVMILRKISSLSVGLVTAGSIQNEGAAARFH
jgi:hypothetical protein